MLLCDNLLVMGALAWASLQGERRLLVDTHAHLTDAVFDADRDEVLKRASAAGVERIVSVALDLESSNHCLNLARQVSEVEATVGIHPAHSLGFESDAADIFALMQSPGICAVGEIGLDYGRCEVPRDQQLGAFRTQVQWAVELGLPVIVHNREAHEDVLSVLVEYHPTGVLHCFSGDAGFAERVAELDLFISFAGNVSYKNAHNLHEVAQAVSMERLMIETDAPFLPPQSHRGRRNEPAFVAEVAECIAELTEWSPSEVAAATSANAARCFGWN